MEIGDGQKFRPRRAPLEKYPPGNCSEVFVRPTSFAPSSESKSGITRKWVCAACLDQQGGLRLYFNKQHKSFTLSLVPSDVLAGVDVVRL